MEVIFFIAGLVCVGMGVRYYINAEKLGVEKADTKTATWKNAGLLWLVAGIVIVIIGCYVGSLKSSPYTTSSSSSSESASSSSSSSSSSKSSSSSSSSKSSSSSSYSKSSSSSSSSKSSSSSFTNKYGTATTKCAHSGCNNYIASSGDTNCCTTHSNRCLECNKYIDEDAMYCMSCITKAASSSKSSSSSSSSSSKKTCYVCEKKSSSCEKIGSYWYCPDCAELMHALGY